jgi:hypothetical protein
MPGLLENTVYTGYGYLDPYVTPYVEKARNSVPLIDRAANRAEEVVPSLITRVDEFAEPRIEKIRPIVEPRIEQVKEIATPYVDSGVKKYEAVKTESCKAYSQAMDYKNSKVAEVQKIKDEAMDYTNSKVAEVQKIKDQKISQAMDYTNCKVAKVQKIKDDKISWCKKMLCNKGAQVNQLFRVPATDNVEGLKNQGVMGKMASLLDKAEGLVDKYLPALPKGAKSEPLESEYDSSYLLPRLFLLVVSVQTRLVYATKSKFDVTLQAGKTKFQKIKNDVTEQITSLKTATDKKVRPIVEPKVDQVKAIVMPKYEVLKVKVTAQVEAIMKTEQYKQACQLPYKVVTCIEKVIGVEKTKSLIKAVEVRIPACWKAAPPAPPKKLK